MTITLDVMIAATSIAIVKFYILLIWKSLKRFAITQILTMIQPHFRRMIAAEISVRTNAQHLRNMGLCLDAWTGVWTVAFSKTTSWLSTISI